MSDLPPFPAPQVLAAPESVEAEMNLLGSILIDPNLLDHLDWFKSEWFFTVRHKIIYDVMKAIRDRKEDLDLITLAEELRLHKLLGDIGGTAYITQLSNSTETHVHYRTYARLIQETSRQREVINLSGELATSAVIGDPDLARSTLNRLKALLDGPTDEIQELSKYLVHVSDLENLPEINWLIPGQLPERGLVMYFGPSGVGKSFVALHKALTLAEHIPVVYIAAEGQYGFKNRVAAWCKHFKKEQKNLKLYFFMNTVSLLDERERTNFMKVIAPLNPGLVVVDTVAHCMLPGNENDTMQMGLFVKGTLAMQQKFSCATLLVHHTNKGGKVYRGSGSLGNACDVIVRISDDDGMIIFECTKSKDAVMFDSEYLKLVTIQIDEKRSSPVVIPAEKVIQSKNDPLSKNQQKLLYTLQMSAYSGGLTRTELMEITEIGNGSVGRALSRLIEFGHVTQDYKGGKYLAIQTTDSHKPDQASHDVDTDDMYEIKDNDSFDSQKTQGSKKKTAGSANHASQTSRKVIVPEFGKTAPKYEKCPICKATRPYILNEKGSWVCKICEANRNKDQFGRTR